MDRHRFWLVALGLVFALGLSGCGGGRRTALTVKGSDTMVILGQRWAESYMAAHPGELVQVTGIWTAYSPSAVTASSGDVRMVFVPKLWRGGEPLPSEPTHFVHYNGGGGTWEIGVLDE